MIRVLVVSFGAFQEVVTPEFFRHLRICRACLGRQGLSDVFFCGFREPVFKLSLVGALLHHPVNKTRQPARTLSAGGVDHRRPGRDPFATGGVGHP